MIKIDQTNQKVIIECAKKAALGTVIVSSRFTKDGRFLLLIREPALAPTVGDLIDEKDIKPIPTIEIEFHIPGSIDSFLNAFHHVKAMMVNPETYRALAC